MLITLEPLGLFCSNFVHIMLYESVQPSVCPPQSVSEIAPNSFDQIMHHSARNDQFAFHTRLVAPETD